MVVYGIRAKLILTKLLNLMCAACGQGEQYLHVFQRYIHVFWIPLVPANKVLVLECKHCKKATEQKEISPTQMVAVNQAKQEAKLPIWMFSGSVLVAGLIAFLVMQGNRETEATKQYIQSPLAGDMAVVKVEEEYQVLKVQSVGPESLQILPGNYAYKKATSAKRDMQKREDEAEYFSATPVDLPLSAYRSLDIRYIVRPEK